jgi:hypothetical protein
LTNKIFVLYCGPWPGFSMRFLRIVDTPGMVMWPRVKIRTFNSQSPTEILIFNSHKSTKISTYSIFAGFQSVCGSFARTPCLFIGYKYIFFPEIYGRFKHSCSKRSMLVWSYIIQPFKERVVNQSKLNILKRANQEAQWDLYIITTSILK